MKAYAKLQNKTESDVEKLVDKFNQLADERIDCIRLLPFFSNDSQRRREGRIDTFHWAKVNLGRLAKEVLAE